MTAIKNAGGTASQMTVEVLSQFRAALEEQRAFRTEQLDELMTPAADGPFTAVDAARDEVVDALRTGAAAALNDIEAALERIRCGSYGSCETCTRKIPFERLEVVPMAALCIQCAHASQQRGR
jgi:DnaK suppressor protein